MNIEYIDENYVIVRIDAIFCSGYSCYKFIDSKTLEKISPQNGWFSSQETAKKWLETYRQKNPGA